MGTVARLSPADLNNLAVEAPDTPMHQAVLASLEAGGLLDGDGHVPIAEIQALVESRLGGVPELRRILYRPGFGKGGPLWVDDPGFRIENHVAVAALPAPGGEEAAWRFAEHEMARPMDRARPLWRIWLLEGYAPDRVGLLITVHHAVADGPAMVNMLAQILDLEPAPARRLGVPWTPAPRPTDRELMRDNLRQRLSGVRGAASRLAHPMALTRSALHSLAAAREVMREGRGAPRTSLNRPIHAPRRIAALHLSLAEVREAAHREGATVNDLFLCLVAAGLRRVLLDRGEAVEDRRIHASVAVSAHRLDAPTSGNHAGVMLVPLPIDIAEPRELLAAIARATAHAKSSQLPVVSTKFMVSLARAGITRLYVRHQHLLNVLTTNVAGPPMALFFAGARVRDPVALAPIAGNVTVLFAALSYAGGLNLGVVADADAWPDIDVLTAGMRESWSVLNAAPPAVALSA